MYNVDQFLLNASLLTESKIISSLSDIMDSGLFNDIFKRYLPKTSARYGSISNELAVLHKVNFNTKENKKLNSIINSQIDHTRSKNISIKTFYINDDNIDAFTVPGISLNMDVKNISLSKLLFGSYHAKKYQIDGGISDHNRILLTASSKVMPLIITTSGFTKNKILTNDEKIAVIMHEVGHWSSPALNRQIPESILSLLTNTMKFISGISTVRSIIDPNSYNLKSDIKLKIAFFSLILLLVFIFIRNIFSKSSEFAADAFVKKIGRAKLLSDAFRKFEGKSSIENKEELKEIETLSDKFAIIFDLFSNDPHPSMSRRVGRLLEDASVLQEGRTADFSVAALDKIVTPIMGKLDSIVARKFRPMLWAYGST